ncbi:MAG: 16S rRNA (uracil(1498)-N(3))-methyltransferase [Alphaproteobacteria bacterium]|nr:16S rRNA (uracil(1498)-N(3))-methyltransferase [Alphaproteobacteria bacterium]
MKNIPRIFIDHEIKTGDSFPIDKSVSHYLSHVMRTQKCLVFGFGHEFNAELSADGKTIKVGTDTGRADVVTDITLYFSPIKRTDDLIAMVTQMGIKKFVPVITERTVNHHVNWERMQKIAIESAEQSNCNSVPEIVAPIKFGELDLSGLCFADERFAYNKNNTTQVPKNAKAILVGPEGGFSDAEFDALDKLGAIPVSLGKTILRAEVAAVIAIEKILK